MNPASYADVLLAIVYSTVLEYVQRHELLACITYLEALRNQLPDTIDSSYSTNTKEIKCTEEVATMMKRLKHDVKRHLSSKKNKQQRRDPEQDRLYPAPLPRRDSNRAGQSDQESEADFSQYSVESVGFSQISSLTSNHNFEIQHRLHRHPGIFPARSPMIASPQKPFANTPPSPIPDSPGKTSELQMHSCGPKLQNIVHYCLLEIRYLFITRQLNKADNMLRLKKYDKALKAYNLIPINKLLRDSSDPSNEDPQANMKLPYLTALYQFHHNKGITLLKLHQVDNSIESFKKSIEIAQSINLQQQNAEGLPTTHSSTRPLYHGCENSAENLAIALIHAENYQEAMHILVALQKQLRLRLKQVPHSDSDNASGRSKSEHLSEKCSSEKSSGDSAGNCCELQLSGDPKDQKNHMHLCHICTTISPQLLHCNLAQDSLHAQASISSPSVKSSQVSSSSTQQKMEIRADVVRSLCLAFCYTKLNRLIEAEHILTKFATVQVEKGTDRFHMIFRDEYEDMFVSNAQLYNGWKMLYRMVDRERKVLMKIVSEGEDIGEMEMSSPHSFDISMVSSDINGKDKAKHHHQQQHSMTLPFENLEKALPAKQLTQLAAGESVFASAATTRPTNFTSDTDKEPSDAISFSSKLIHDGQCLSPASHRNEQTKLGMDQEAKLLKHDRKQSSKISSHVTQVLTSKSEKSYEASPATCVESSIGSQTPASFDTNKVKGSSSSLHSSSQMLGGAQVKLKNKEKMELNIPLISSTPPATSRSMQSDESVSTLSSSTSRITQQSASQPRRSSRQRHYKPLSPPMSITDSNKLFSSNIVAKCHSMALEKPNLRSPGIGKMDFSAKNYPPHTFTTSANDHQQLQETVVQKEAEIVYKNEISATVATNEIFPDDSVSFIPPPVSIEKPLRKSNKNLNETLIVSNDFEDHVPSVKIYSNFSPVRKTLNASPSNFNYLSDISIVTMLQDESRRQDTELLLLDFSEDYSIAKTCFSPPPPRTITPPLSKKNQMFDFSSFSPIKEVPMVSSPIIDASHIIADIVDVLEMSRIAPKPQLTVQNNGHISSSWSSPERNAALVSSPDHLQPYYSPLTENSDSTEAVSPALYEDDLAPSQHFLSPTKVSFSPVVSSFGNQFSPKSSIRANPIPQSPGFSMDNSATSMSSTPVMLKSVTTASKQDRLELFMKFQPAGYQIQGPIPLQQFAQGWYPGAQTWVTFSYKDLTYPGPYPKDVDVRKRECYLSNDEFQRTFMMNRQVFYELPAWKQILLRKSCKLF